MSLKAFRRAVAEIGFSAVPEKFRELLSNVALIVEDEPRDGEPLLGLYQGVPQTQRADGYGILSMPDTITLYRKPILDEAAETGMSIQRVIRDTIWHEVAHHFGLDEDDVEERERRRGQITQ